MLLLCGGKSAEHEVSLQSARNVAAALDPKKYEVTVLGIDKGGGWHVLELPLLSSGELRALPAKTGGNTTLSIPAREASKPYDVVFPILHGPLGEDGTMQGLLTLMDVPFVGAGVLGSAVGMDKDVMKRLLRDAGLPIAKFVVYHAHEKPKFMDAKKKLGLPMFVKPANLGSSVGVSKVHTEKEFKAALARAFAYDTKVLVEECIEGREIECAVLGNEKPLASVPGELVIRSDFYSYEAKYLDPDAMVPEIPARLPKLMSKKIQAMALEVFKVLSCEGMGRVDFFVTKRGKIYVNEINTIPGFTNISMYPKMWEASGLSYAKLIDRLIELALQRHARQRQLRTSR